ncbi:MAG: helix-turn-helix domain-containing protein, partial [Bacteroidales bacterium]
IILVQNLIYLVWIGLIISRNKGTHGILGKRKLTRKNWLRLMLIAFIFLWVVQFNSFMVMDMYRKYKLCPYTSSLYFGSVFIVINVIIYNAIDISDVFKQNLKYSYSKLTSDQIDKIYNNLEILMKEEELYINPDLQISTLSGLISVPQKQLSQVINLKTNQSFNDFINTYRIEKNKKLLQESHTSGLTISEILYKVGFNTRSSFYKCFKENIGVTPTEYKSKYIL